MKLRPRVIKAKVQEDLKPLRVKEEPSNSFEGSIVKKESKPTHKSSENNCLNDFHDWLVQNDSPLTSLPPSPALETPIKLKKGSLIDAKLAKNKVKRKRSKLPKVKTEDMENIKLESKEIVPGLDLALKNSTNIPPSDWKEVYLKIREYRKTHLAPVDSMGCERTSATNLSPVEFRFHVLVSLMLSSQTRDEETYVAVTKLREASGNSLSAESLNQMNEDLLHDCIRQVGFHNQKAKFLKKMAKSCIEKYGGDIPPTLKELMELSGVGPKMGFLAMQCAWNVNVGIGVDVHVHRIANRLNWVKTATAEKTREALEKLIPSEWWKEINFLMVGFGQTVCTGLRPRCYECPVALHCPSRDFKALPTKNSKSTKRTSVLPSYFDGTPKVKLDLESLSKSESNHTTSTSKVEDDYIDQTKSKYFCKVSGSSDRPIRVKKEKVDYAMQSAEDF